MADPGDLAALADVRAWLNLSGTGDDALLGSLITAVSGFIAGTLGRPVLSADYTETRDGTGGRILVFGVTPVTAILSLTIDGRNVPPVPDDFHPGYRFTATRLSLYGFRLTRGFDNIAIGYTAGYDEVPADLAHACIQLVGLAYRQRDRIGLTARGLGGETTGFLQKAMPDDVAMTLQRYRRVVPL